MEQASRRTPAGKVAGGWAKRRLILALTVIAASVMLVAAISGGSALIAGWLAGLGRLTAALAGPAGILILALAAGAVLVGLLLRLRRRARPETAFIGRAFRGQAQQPARDGEPLIQVQGRGAFLAGLNDRLAAHAQEGRQLAVHRLDIARFREVNHLFGSDAGDRLLGEVRRRLAELAGEPGHLARLGDDEFAVVQPEAGGAKHAEIFAARLQKALEEPMALGVTEMPVTVSVGIAVAPEHGSDAQRLLTSADLALKAAQQAGAGTIRSFAAEMDQGRERRRALMDAMAQAMKSVDECRFVLRYQPQYDLGQRRLTGFELLVRLEHRPLGVVEEAELAEAAHAAGLLPAITERAVREACRMAARWPQHLRLGVNLGQGHLACPDLARMLADILKANHLSPGRIDLEVDEPAVGSGGELAVVQLRRLAEAGFRLVLDDYGGGRCAPAGLWREPFAAVKIGGGLLGRLGQGEGVERLVGAIIKVAQTLDLEVIADGVDGADQLQFLMLNGCRNVAGPILGPAMASAKVAAIIDKDAKSAAGAHAAAA